MIIACLLITLAVWERGGTNNYSLLREETLVIVWFPLTVNVAKLRNNARITKHTHFPSEFAAAAAAGEETKPFGCKY